MPTTHKKFYNNHTNKGNDGGNLRVTTEGTVVVKTVYREDIHDYISPTELPNATRTNSRPYRIRVQRSLKVAYQAYVNDERGHRFTGWNFRKCMRTRQFVPIPLPPPDEKATEKMTVRILPEEHRAFKEFCKAWKVPQWFGFWLLAATPLTVFDRPIEPVRLAPSNGQEPTMTVIPNPSKREAVLMLIRAILPLRGERFSEEEFRRETVLVSKLLDETGFDIALVAFAYKDALREREEADARFVYKHRERLFGRAERVRAEQVKVEEKKRKYVGRPCVIVERVGTEGKGSQTIGQPMSYTTTNENSEFLHKSPYGTLLRSEKTNPVGENGFSADKSPTSRIMRYLVALRGKPIESELWEFSKEIARKLLKRVGYDTEIAKAVIKLARYLYPDADFRFVAKHMDTLVAAAFAAKRKRDELRALRRAQTTYYTAGFPRRALLPPRRKREGESEFGKAAKEILRKLSEQIEERTRVFQKPKAAELLQRKREVLRELTEKLGKEVEEGKYDPLLTLCPVHRHFVKFCPQDCYIAQKVREGRVREHPSQFPQGYFDLCEGCGRFKRKCICGTGESWREKVFKPIVRLDWLTEQPDDEFALCEGCGQFVKNCKCTEQFKRWREHILQQAGKRRDSKGEVLGDEFAMCVACGKFVKDCKCERPLPITSDLRRLERELRKLAERDGANEIERTDRSGLYEDTGVAYLDKLLFGSEGQRKRFYCPQCGREMAYGSGNVVACLWCKKEFIDFWGVLIEVERDEK